MTRRNSDLQSDRSANATRAGKPEKRVAIIQSNYLPWKGYFDIIHEVDLFVFLDDVQYTTGDWRNRNRFKTAQGVCWLTVPIGNQRRRLICEIELRQHGWQNKHWRSLTHFYSRAPYFKKYQPWFEPIFLEKRWNTLSELNQSLIRMIARDILGIRTECKDSREYNVSGEKTQRLLEILQKAGATHYLSGPAAKNYLDESLLRAAGITFQYKDYRGYPEYPQLYPPFTHEVSILDLIFSAGPAASYYIWGWRQAAARSTQPGEP